MNKYVIPALSALFLGTTYASTEADNEWRFNVYLDDKEIGYHHFRVEDAGDQHLVATDAQFNVKFLFFNAYRYQHQNRELWRNGCLQGLESRTDDNGESFRVVAEKRNDAFIVESRGQESSITGCVKSFAYWDPSFLSADKLLNAQTGEHLDVTVQDLGPDQIEVRGNSVPANRYRLIARDMMIDLWYSPQRQWLALESRTNSGRLRYRIK